MVDGTVVLLICVLLLARWCDPFPHALPRQGADAGACAAATTVTHNIVSPVTLVEPVGIHSRMEIMPLLQILYNALCNQYVTYINALLLVIVKFYQINVGTV